MARCHRQPSRLGEPSPRNAVRAGLAAALLLGGLVGALFAQQPRREAPPPPAARAPAIPAPRSVDPSDATAQGPADSRESLKEALNRHGDLTLRDTELSQALFLIGDQWKVNISVGESISGRVNLVFKDAPLSEVLEAVLGSHGYGYRLTGRSLVVMEASKLGDANPLFVSAAIPCQGAAAKDIATSAKLLASPQGKVEAVESVNSLVVFDFPERVEAIRKFVGELNQCAQAGGQGASAKKLEPRRFPLQFVDAEKMTKSLTPLLSPDGKIAAVELQNELVVWDQPARLEMVAKMIDQIDRPRSQVRITALIYDVSLKDMERLGINWKSVVKGRYNSAGVPETTFTVDSVTQTPTMPGDLGGVITFMNLSRSFDLTAVVQALQECHDSRLLANPNVSVLNNDTAKFSVVTEIPYQQLTQTQQGGNIGTTDFREAGVQMEVTPRIANDGTIQMKVKPAFSRLAGFTPGATPQPIIDRRESETTVRVYNQQTLVIGGLRTRRDLGDFTGIPILKDIKLFGMLFRNRETETEETELVVFLRPELIDEAYPGEPREQADRELTDALLDHIPAAVGPQPCPPKGPRSYGPGQEAEMQRGLRPWQDAPAEAVDAPPGRQSKSTPAGAPRTGSRPPDLHDRLTQPAQRPGAAPRTARSDPRGAASKAGQTPSAPAGRSATAAAPSKSRTKSEPSAWEKLFGSKEHPDGILAQQRPTRVPFEKRFSGGDLRGDRNPRARPEPLPPVDPPPDDRVAQTPPRSGGLAPAGPSLSPSSPTAAPAAPRSRSSARSPAKPEPTFWDKLWKR